MAALTADRKTPERSGVDRELPVAASTTIYAGSIVVLDSSGNAEPGTTATGKTAAGRAEEQVDNSSGSAGDVDVKVKSGVFKFENSSGDAVDKSHVGSTVYIEDDQTVSATDGGSTQSAAGTCYQVDSDGVWVAVGTV